MNQSFHLTPDTTVILYVLEHILLFIMDYLKRFVDKRNRNLVPLAEYSDQEPETASTKEDGEDETLLYSPTGFPQARGKQWTRYICTSALIICVMVCCFAGGFLLRGATQPRLWNFDHYDIRKCQ